MSNAHTSSAAIYEAKMTFSNIQEIRDHKWVGNHFSDHAAFNAVDAFALDASRPIAERAEALRIEATAGMGLTVEDDSTLALPDAELVAAYIADCA